MSTPRRHALLTASIAVAALAAAPAAAGAVTVMVTGDDGAPIAVNGPVSIRYLNPDVSLALASGEHYGYTVTAPGGQQAAVGDTCAASGQARRVDYFANGAYTVGLTQYSDAACSPSKKLGTSSVQFTIDGGVGLTGPAGPVLTRQPGGSVTNRLTLAASLNPGAVGNQVFYGVNSALAPDGSLARPAGQLVASPAAGTVDVPLDKGPGTYRVVGRAEGFNTAGDVFTPWSPAVSFAAFVPFDIKRLSFPDRRGPSYRLRATFREPAVSGRVAIAIARGFKRGRYRALGSARVRGHSVAKRFRAPGPGLYRIRFTYKGNRSVAAGFEVDKIRISRRAAARGA